MSPSTGMFNLPVVLWPEHTRLLPDASLFTDPSVLAYLLAYVKG